MEGIPNFGCPGARPHPRFDCINGTWILQSPKTILIRGDVNVTLENNGAVINGSVLIRGGMLINCGGTLVLVANATVGVSDIAVLCGQLIVGPIANSSKYTLDTVGCTTLLPGSVIRVDLSSITLNSSSVSLNLLKSDCGLNGNVTVSLENIPTDPCKQFVTREIRTEKTLSVLLEVDSSRCATPSAAAQSDPLSTGAAVGIAVGIAGGLIALLLITIIAVPKLRYKCFPFMLKPSTRLNVLNAAEPSNSIAD